MAKKRENMEVHKAVLIWDKHRFETEIALRIDVGRNLLSIDVPFVDISSMYGYGYKSKKQYDEAAFEIFKQEKIKWENVTEEILQQAFDIPNNNYYNDFSKAGYIAIVMGNEDWLVEYKKEISRKIVALESILEKLPYIPFQELKTTSTPNDKIKKIFISHSSADQKFAEALIDLLNTMGLGQEEIFCSSIPGYWIGNGKNFLDEIKTHFVNYDLFVIFIHSPRFYNSHVSLNEMGAAWVLQSEYCSFLTNDMEYDQMDAVVTSHEIAIKVNTNEAKSRLNDWKMRILDWFGKSDINANIWERSRDKFLNEVNALRYPSIYETRTVLTKKDIERLKVWIEANDNQLFQVWYTGESAVFGLGAKNQYEVNSARDMAEWRGFFKRLIELRLIEHTGYTRDGKHPIYQLTESAYQYFDE